MTSDSNKSSTSPTLLLDDIYNEDVFPIPPPPVYMKSPRTDTKNLMNAGPLKTFLINVNGRKFEVGARSFCKLEPYLALEGVAAVKHQDGISTYFVERHAPSFAAILDYFQTGELHMPTDVCPKVFQRELLCWGVDSKAMSQCCLRRYISFHQNEITLAEFEQSFFDGNTLRSGKQSRPLSTWDRVRRRGWAILDDPRSSKWAKAYMALATTFVILSVFILAASTHSAFARSLTPEEWEEYFNEDELNLYWDVLFKDKPRPQANSPPPPVQPQPTGSSSFWSNNFGQQQSVTDPNNSSGTAQPQPSPSLPPHNVGKRSAEEGVTLEETTTDDVSYMGPIESSPWITDHYMKASDESSNGGTDDLGDGNRHKDKGIGIGNIITDFVDSMSRHLVLHKGVTEKDVRKLIRNYQIARQDKLRREKVDRNGRIAGIGTVYRLVFPKQEKKDGNRQDGVNLRDLLQDVMIMKQSGSEGAERDGKDSEEHSHEETGKPENEMASQFSRKVKFEPLDEDVSYTDDRDQPLFRHRRATHNSTFGGSNDTLFQGTNTSLDTANCYIVTHEDLLTFMIVNSDHSYDNAISETNLPSNVFTMVDWIRYLEMVCIIYFTAEFIIRLIFAPERLRYLFTFFTILDFVSLMTMYVVMLLNYFESKEKYTSSYIDIINLMQLVRVFRFFRLVKDVTGFRVLVFTVRSSWRDLLLLVMYILLAVTVFASVMYICEKENMLSIPDAAWWAIVTMTTVGYGDMVPCTAVGKLVGGACTVSGVILIAVTVPVFVNNFLLFYEHSKLHDINQDGYVDREKPQDTAEDSGKSQGKKSPQIAGEMADYPVGNKKYAFDNPKIKNGVQGEVKSKSSFSAASNTSKRSNTSVSKVQPFVNP